MKISLRSTAVSIKEDLININNKQMNKIKIGLLTLGLMVAGVAGAALLDTYVTTAGTATVSQAITWGDGTTTLNQGNARDYSILGAGGGTYEHSHGNLKNNANNPVKIEFVNSKSSMVLFYDVQVKRF